MLIDRFALDIPVPANSTIQRQSYFGIFGLADIDLSFRLECSENFYGINCDVFCLQDCNINHCAGVNCGENQRCVNEILNYTCVCEPGYTRPDCSTEFDVCMEVNCNSGSCVAGVGSCTCYPGYTGQFCERRLDGYELQVTIHSFSNNNGRCADSQCGLNYCCERRPCPNSCEYYFSLCQRVAGTPVSTVRSVDQGNCMTVESNPSRTISDGSTFTDRVFGTPNPIILTGLIWVSGMAEAITLGC